MSTLNAPLGIKPFVMWITIPAATKQLQGNALPEALGAIRISERVARPFECSRSRLAYVRRYFSANKIR
jgi:hypothetical protein